MKERKTAINWKEPVPLKKGIISAALYALMALIARAMWFVTGGLVFGRALSFERFASDLPVSLLVWGGFLVVFLLVTIRAVIGIVKTRLWPKWHLAITEFFLVAGILTSGN